MITSIKQDIVKTIVERRSVFPNQFTAEPVTRKELETLLEVANWAPSHKQTEPWRFKVMQGETLTNFSDFMAEKYKATAPKFSARKYEKIITKFKQSSAVLAVCMQRDLKERIPEWEEIAATAMAVQNLWLAAESLGIGGYWSTPGTLKYFSEFTELSVGETCLGFFYLGHYDQPLLKGGRGPWQDKVEWL